MAMSEGSHHPTKVTVLVGRTANDEPPPLRDVQSEGGSDSPRTLSQFPLRIAASRSPS
jgi:hypothetical protein